MMLSHSLMGLARGPFLITLSGILSATNIRTKALADGWDGAAKVIVTVSAGAQVRGIVVNGSFPNGVEMINNGAITGLGGIGGGGGYGSSAGSSGGDGTTALNVSTPLTVTNNGGIYGGGGGGGGGGGSVAAGGAQGAGGSGGVGAYFGSAAGSGSTATNPAGNGGNGGALGTAGSFGFQGFDVPAGTPTGRGSPGNAGYAVTGNSNITWLVLGTRTGPIA